MTLTMARAIAETCLIFVVIFAITLGGILILHVWLRKHPEQRKEIEDEVQRLRDAP